MLFLPLFLITFDYRGSKSKHCRPILKHMSADHHYELPRAQHPPGVSILSRLFLTMKVFFSANVENFEHLGCHAAS